MRRITSLFCLLVVQLIFLSIAVFAQEEPNELTETSKMCLKCHAQNYYSFYNSTLDQTKKKRMNPFLQIDSMKYAQGVHGGFSCDDCHSSDYATYPHESKLKFEYMNTCQDCHVGDASYAHLHFDEIEQQSLTSVHAVKMGDAFKCEMCHNPHANQVVATSEKYTLQEIVAFDNNMCLSCHGDLSKFQTFTDNEIPEILKTHDWLPNQSLHFKNVRCIECHTPRTDTLMVTHNIRPKEEAIKNCVECHSSNSLLKGKLYKYLSKESRIKDGLPATIKNESYVIGANHNIFLRNASFVFFLLIVVGILIHLIIRIVNRK